MKTKNKKLLFLSLISLFLIGCKKDTSNPKDVIPTEENELITTMELTFTGKGELGGDTTFVVTFNDPDGEGGNAPIQFDTIRLLKNSSYSVEVMLFDKSKSPMDTISNEVVEEANDHLFFYTPNPSQLVHVTINDKDLNSKNLGMKSTWSTQEASSGKITIKLMHQPGIKDGESEVGDTDVEIDFPLYIK